MTVSAMTVSAMTRTASTRTAGRGTARTVSAGARGGKEVRGGPT